MQLMCFINMALGWPPPNIAILEATAPWREWSDLALGGLQWIPRMGRKLNNYFQANDTETVDLAVPRSTC